MGESALGGVPYLLDVSRRAAGSGDHGVARTRVLLHDTDHLPLGDDCIGAVRVVDRQLDELNIRVDGGVSGFDPGGVAAQDLVGPLLRHPVSG